MDPKSYRMAHPIYALKDIESIKVTHRKVEGMKDRLALFTVSAARFSVDTATRYNPDKFNER